MESNRLHPLLVTAAVAVTLFSAVGVAALTGVLPLSTGSADSVEPAKNAVTQSEPAAGPAAPEPTAAPKPAPVRKPQKLAQAPQPVAPPPPAPRTQAPQPGIPGVVESVREITVPGEAKGVGAVGGGVLGGVLGSQFGQGSGRKLLTVLGAAGGAVAGHNIEKDANATKRWEISVRLDDGTTRTLTSEALPVWHAGDRVRWIDGQLQPA